MAGSNADQTYDLISLLSGNERDFLVKNNGDQVKISDLKSKIIGLYFSASWCGPCRNFTPKLIETYYDLSQSKPFEVIFISSDNDDESFKSYFSKMPWLAIPFSDSETRNKLSETFKIIGIPTLAVIEGQNGNLVTDDSVGAVMEHGSGAYPFTHERLVELKEEEENAKRNQTIMSVLANDGRDYLVSNKGDKVPVSDLEGKYVFLYFSITGDDDCDDFTSTLSQIYEKLRQKGENFEVVQILLEKEESSFNQTLQKVPFLAIPFKDKSIAKLTRYFELRMPPTLVLIGTDGKTSNPNLSEIIEEHGVEAWEGYPFTEEKLGFLEEEEHELVLTRLTMYGCDGCEKAGYDWSYRCVECDFDLHPKCALKEGNGEDNGEKVGKEGYVCDGDVCRKV
ncbi:hypothetical protein LUZ60_006569 [Juncus effusus]|nr:hypothetical protein LUZ60_006569 [Juncus effusus]